MNHLISVSPARVTGGPRAIAFPECPPHSLAFHFHRENNP
ncbi:hypothetical protein Acav_0770 [Paracidovorax avenae ATCC 19860]|uniref:Uncharacterized protein n=1 Tax=Paracidovorax avenae (strain ATCC 19860 / DSM 7227 / CCUG 15838 / JCM 20985 / LMG 2117 / NCPPB 1011) TaxID=643561 RepID=F0Q8M5_PARA1|nr:hypothetical protein Acav_0770 [Paracidovorax avenae ATCC 19860]